MFASLASIQPAVALGVGSFVVAIALILIAPRFLSYIVATYLAIVGAMGVMLLR